MAGMPRASCSKLSARSVSWSWLWLQGLGNPPIGHMGKARFEVSLHVGIKQGAGPGWCWGRCGHRGRARARGQCRQVRLTVGWAGLGGRGHRRGASQIAQVLPGAGALIKDRLLTSGSSLGGLGLAARRVYWAIVRKVRGRSSSWMTGGRTCSGICESTGIGKSPNGMG